MSSSPLSLPDMTCELCAGDGGEVLWRDPHCRVVYVDEPGYPGYCRVIWNAHVGEMTDLSGTDRALLMDVVLAVEAVLRKLLRPEKMNLASLGNLTPHLHWHVIPRRADDRHYPNPIWGAPMREPPADTRRPASDIRKALVQKLRRS